MGKIFIVSKILAIVFFMMLLLGTTLPTQAGGGGHYTFLNFPGADAGHCTGWYVSADPYDASTWVRFWEPGVVQYTLTDGTGRVIIQGSQNILNGQPANHQNVQLQLQSYGMPNADWTGAKNPIHAVVTVDGDLVADLTANNPCLTSGSSSSSSSSSGGSSASTRVAPPVPADACSLHTSSKNLTVRNGPGTSFSAVGVLQAQQEYAILAQGKDKSGTTWLKIDLPGVNSAWVISTYATISTHCSNAESTQEAPSASTTEQAPSLSTTQEVPSPSATEETPSATVACTVTARSNGLRQRSGPSTNFSIIGLMENGTEYPVLGMSMDSHGANWWQIDAGDAGSVWVISSSTITHGDCTGVAQVTPAPQS